MAGRVIDFEAMVCMSLQIASAARPQATLAAAGDLHAEQSGAEVEEGPRVVGAVKVIGPALAPRAALPLDAALDGQSCPGLSDAQAGRGCAVGAASHKSKVMLTISGLRRRLVVNSTLEHVIKALVQDGHAVHVYMSIVDKPDNNSWLKVRLLEHEVPEHRGLTLEELRPRLIALVEGAGGCMMCLFLKSKPEVLPSIPDTPIINARMQQYRPLLTNVGRNVLRVWQVRQRLWDRAQQAERLLHSRYALAMWVREDTQWTSRLLDIRPLLRRPKAASTVWSKGCATWGGLNDKVVLSGRHAADTMFRAYDRFFKQTGPSLAARNSEEFLMKMANVHAELQTIVLSHEKLPFGDAMYIGSPTPYCFVKLCWCGDPSVSKYNTSFCKDVAL